MNAIERRESMKTKKCPKCKKTYLEHPAISRVDNKTKICPECGTREAIEAFEKHTKNSKVAKK